MLISVYHGTNARLGHPIRHMFLKEPSWVLNAFDTPLDEYLKALEDENRKYPVWPNAVVDYESQIFEKWPWIEADPNLYVLSLTTILKADQEPAGGWRWHKWGDYLGDKDPQHEYLYDEGPEITQAVVVSVNEIDPQYRDEAIEYLETHVGIPVEGF